MENFLSIITEVIQAMGDTAFTIEFYPTPDKDTDIVPYIELKLDTKSGVRVSYFLSEDEVNTITKEELQNNCLFLITQEFMRRNAILTQTLMKG